MTHCLLLCACSCIVVDWIAAMKVETLLAGLMTHWHCVDCTLLLLLLLVVTLLPILILIFHIYERNMCPLVKILEEIIERHLKIFVMLDDGFLALSIGEGGGCSRPDARHLFCHLAPCLLACCLHQPDYTFIPAQWQMCRRYRCATYCAFSPFFGHAGARTTSADHMEMQGH